VGTIRDTMPGVLIVLIIVLLPAVAGTGWWMIVQSRVSGTAARATATGIWLTFQFSGGLALLGWTGLLQVRVAVGFQLVLTIAVLMWGLSERRSAPTEASRLPSERSEARSVDWSRRLLMVLLVIGGIVVALIALRTAWYATLIPIDGSDGSSYHLPALIEALNHGGFGRPQSVTVFAWTSPKAADMAFLWLMLGRNLDLVLFGQIVFIPLAIASTAAVSVWAGTSNRVGWAFGSLILFIPIVVVQSTTAYVDIAAGALFIAAIAAMVLYRFGTLHSSFGVLTVFAAVGLAAGSKYSLLLPAALILVATFLPDLRHRSLTRAHVVGIAVLLVGAHWYLAPIVWYGNPAWPYAMPFLPDVFGSHLLTVDHVVDAELGAAPSLAGASWLGRLILVWKETGPAYDKYTFASHQSGLGPLWFVVWLPAIAALGLLWAKDRRYVDLGLFVGVVAAAFGAQAYPWWTRFTWWIAVVGIVATAVVYQRSTNWIRTMIAGLLVGGGMYVLAFTNVQGIWNAPTIERLLEGEAKELVVAGEAVAHGYVQDREVIAVPALDWGSWNTYLRGEHFTNSIVVVPPGDALEQRLRAVGATMVFDPASSVATWPSGALDSLGACIELVRRDDGTEQSIYRFVCP
jgi:hypothetical protein